MVKRTYNRQGASIYSPYREVTAVNMTFAQHERITRANKAVLCFIWGIMVACVVSLLCIGG